MTRAATRKKLARKFEVGDVVTWGNGSLSYPVVEITTEGVIVDSSADQGGRERHLVPFVPVKRYGAEHGPPRLVEGAKKKKGRCRST